MTEEERLKVEIIGYKDTIERLLKQIEKMKRCEICSYGGNDFGICYSNKPCKNKNQWKLAK